MYNWLSNGYAFMYASSLSGVMTPGSEKEVKKKKAREASTHKGAVYLWITETDAPGMSGAACVKKK